MNKTVKLIALTVTVAMIGVNGAAHAAQGSANATATILSPVTVTKTTDLAFGKIVSTSSAANVTITPAGVLTCGNGLTCSGTTSAAAFDVAGSTGEVVTVASDASVTLTSGANTMAATLNTSVPTLTLAGGAGSFQVGGVLAVGANQAAGAYTGAFNVTVNYQ